MDKQTKQWIASTKAWIKVQKESISSCDLSIKHSIQIIESNHRNIILQKEEKLLKINQLKEVEKNLRKYIK